MNIFKALGLKGKGNSGVARPNLTDKLPEVNAFVDLAFGGHSLRESVPINDVNRDGLTVRRLDGIEPGTTGDFLYVNPLGRFRFATVCSKVQDKEAWFEMPASIKTIERFSARRMAERVPWVLPVQWRYAPDGAGYGNFLPASMMDLSRGGASLAVGRELKVGSKVEVKFTLDAENKPFIQVCEVMRATRIETSDKYGAGIAFVELDGKSQKILNDYLFERQKLRRERGVV
jgi:hypothetical protein